MNTLESLCAEGPFSSRRLYELAVLGLSELVRTGVVVKIKPRVISKWDHAAEFYLEPSTRQIYKLHHPEPPSRGEWARMAADDLQDGYDQVS